MTTLTTEQIAHLRELAEIAPQLKALVDCHLAISAIYSKLPSAEQRPPVAMYPDYAELLGDRLRFRGREYLLTDGEKCVAGAFVRSGRQRLSGTDLESLSGISSPSKILARLVKKYPELGSCVERPGKRCRGGYVFRIRRADQ